MRKNPLFILAVGLLTLALSGCVQISIETDLKKDGSGKTDMTFVILESTTEILEELASIGEVPDVDIANLASLDGKELQARVKDHGVKVKKFKSRLEDGLHTISFRHGGRRVSGQQAGGGSQPGSDDQAGGVDGSADAVR